MYTCKLLVYNHIHVHGVVRRLGNGSTSSVFESPHRTPSIQGLFATRPILVFFTWPATLHVQHVQNYRNFWGQFRKPKWVEGNAISISAAIQALLGQAAGQRCLRDGMRQTVQAAHFIRSCMSNHGQQKPVVVATVKETFLRLSNPGIFTEVQLAPREDEATSRPS